jgi:competence protein ComEA
VTTSQDFEPETAETIRHQVRVEFRIYLVLVALVSLLVGGIIGRYLFQEDTEDSVRVTNPPILFSEPSGSPLPTISKERKVLSVYVSGAVNTSSVVTVPEGSLLVDAIQAAGGATSDADLDAINLASPLRNYDHVLVPRKTDANSMQPAQITLDINTATTQELEALPNIGPTRAEQIVAYRETHGAFQDKEDIMQVPGIGQVIYEQLESLIYVGE